VRLHDALDDMMGFVRLGGGNLFRFTVPRPPPFLGVLGTKVSLEVRLSHS
jgi:hypothetical protein